MATDWLLRYRDVLIEPSKITVDGQNVGIQIQQLGPDLIVGIEVALSDDDLKQCHASTSCVIVVANAILARPYAGDLLPGICHL
jgi:hypothetical protein